MFCTVVVVCPAGSKVSGSMPTAMEKVPPPPPSPPVAGASGSSTEQALSSSPRAAAAASDLTRDGRRRARDVFMVSRSDEVARNWTRSGWDGVAGSDGAGRWAVGRSEEHTSELQSRQY